jgi:hypothetical protein
VLVRPEADLTPRLAGGSGGQQTSHDHGLVRHGGLLDVQVVVEGLDQLLSVLGHRQLLQQLEVVQVDFLLGRQGANYLAVHHQSSAGIFWQVYHLHLQQ